MNIVLLESLAIDDTQLETYAQPLRAQGHDFKAYLRTNDTAALIEEAKDADILMLANMPLPLEVIEHCPHLKYINIAFTGVDHVPVAAAKSRGILVSNASGYSTRAVSELTIGMILTLLRQIREGDERCRQGMTKDGLTGYELFGKTVGIIGTGAIGMHTIKLCQAFGCNILAYNGFTPGKSGEGITYLPLYPLLEQSDVVILHCPLTDKSRNLIDKQALAHMKSSAILINTARGPVVDSQALADALNEGRVAGAGIDVFEMEPPVPSDHPLLSCKNILLSPHMAFSTAESMKLRAGIVFKNVNAFLSGSPENLV